MRGKSNYGERLYNESKTVKLKEDWRRFGELEVMQVI